MTWRYFWLGICLVMLAAGAQAQEKRGKYRLRLDPQPPPIRPILHGTSKIGVKAGTGLAWQNMKRQGPLQDAFEPGRFYPKPAAYLGAYSDLYLSGKEVFLHLALAYFFKGGSRRLGPNNFVQGQDELTYKYNRRFDLHYLNLDVMLKGVWSLDEESVRPYIAGGLRAAALMDGKVSYGQMNFDGSPSEALKEGARADMKSREEGLTFLNDHLAVGDFGPVIAVGLQWKLLGLELEYAPSLIGVYDRFYTPSQRLSVYNQTIMINLTYTLNRFDL